MVASDTYEDPKLGMLRAPAHDAQELARVLGDPAIGAFSVTILQNEPEYRLRRAIGGFFNGVDREDVLLLHLACHGVKDEDGTLYFAAADTETDNLQATALPADFVNSQMNRSPSRRIVLLLDCCYSGAFARGMSHRSSEGVQLKEQFEGSGRVVLTASSSMEYAWEGNDLLGEGKPSVFTSALVRGLEAGEADLDRDGQVSVDELYEYVFDRVRQETPNQTPGKWSFDVAGDLFIAKTKRGAEPVAPPDYLLDLIRSPLSNARVSAVEALRLLLLGNHVGAALGARAALEQLLEDDSRTVANAAADALDRSPQFPETGVVPGGKVPLAVDREAEKQAEHAPPSRGLRSLVEPDAAQQPVREPVEPTTAVRLPPRGRGRTLATMALVGGGLMLVGFFAPIYGNGDTLSYADTPLLWTDAIGAFILAVVCGVLLLADRREESPHLKGFLAGAGLEQVGMQLGVLLSVGPSSGAGWGVILSLIGASLLLSASTVSFHRLQEPKYPSSRSATFTRTSRAVAVLGGVALIVAAFMGDLPATLTIPWSVTAGAAVVSPFIPLDRQAPRAFVASALITYGSLLGIAFLLFDLSAKHYGALTDGSLVVHAVGGFVLGAAGVIAFLAGGQETRLSG